MLKTHRKRRSSTQAKSQLFNLGENEQTNTNSINHYNLRQIQNNSKSKAKTENIKSVVKSAISFPMNITKQNHCRHGERLFTTPPTLHLINSRKQLNISVASLGITPSKDKVQMLKFNKKLAIPHLRFNMNYCIKLKNISKQRKNHFPYLRNQYSILTRENYDKIYKLLIK